MATFTLRSLAGIQLSDAAFAARHRILLRLLWLHLAIVAVIGLATGAGRLGGSDHDGHQHGTHVSANTHAAILWSTLLLGVGCAISGQLFAHRRSSAIWVAVGYIVAAAALVHAGYGSTDLHFDFFVVLALVGLYQNLTAFAVAIVLVAAHHLGMAVTVPEMLFSTPLAQAHPVPWALVHAAFVLAMCAAQVAYWKYTADAQAEMAAVSEAAGEKAASVLRQAAEESARREQQAADRAAAEVARSTELTTELESILAGIGTIGANLADEAGSAMETLQTALTDTGAAVSGSTAKIATAQTEATATLTVIERLRAAIGDISAIAQLIRGVADQTNLLALNATIEAARAGEVGRGFAVVAGEVKELASETGTATTRIATTLDEVNESADAVTRAVTALASHLSDIDELQQRLAGVVEEQATTTARTRQLVTSAAHRVAAAATRTGGE